MAMGASTYLAPLALAVLVSPLLVRGKSCGAMTHAEPGDDFGSLWAKTIANFEANCRGEKTLQSEAIKGSATEVEATLEATTGKGPTSAPSATTEGLNVTRTTTTSPTASTTTQHAAVTSSTGSTTGAATTKKDSTSAPSATTEGLQVNTTTTTAPTESSTTQQTTVTAIAATTNGLEVTTTTTTSPTESSTTQQTTMTASSVGISWPQGVYGLPMPTSGCPTDSGFQWETGSRFHDTEDEEPYNEWSVGLHLKGPYAGNDMWQHFCMKTVDRVSDTDPVWPSGDYCVFKYGQNCPSGMSSGSIFWDDEDTNNGNSVNGTVPSGVYDQDTLIHFCCMGGTGGGQSAPITLPSHSPFYLLASRSKCQEVHGMNGAKEWFVWDGENTGASSCSACDSCPYHSVSNGGNLELQYCYYTTMI